MTDFSNKIFKLITKKTLIAIGAESKQCISNEEFVTFRAKRQEKEKTFIHVIKQKNGLLKVQIMTWQGRKDEDFNKIYECKNEYKNVYEDQLNETILEEFVNPIYE